MTRPCSVHKSLSQTCVVFTQPLGFLSAMFVIDRFKVGKECEEEM